MIQIDIMKDLFERNVSTFGSCWGIQIAAMAIGGTAELSPQGREVESDVRYRSPSPERIIRCFETSVFEVSVSSDEASIYDCHCTGGKRSQFSSCHEVRHGNTESWFVQLS